jgi:hypothetical protein
LENTRITVLKGKIISILDLLNENYISKRWKTDIQQVLEIIDIEKLQTKILVPVLLRLKFIGGRR